MEPHCACGTYVNMGVCSGQQFQRQHERGTKALPELQIGLERRDESWTFPANRVRIISINLFIAIGQLVSYWKIM